MRHFTLLVIASSLLASAAVACTTTTYERVNGNPVTAQPDAGETPQAPCVEGATRCEGDLIATCNAGGTFDATRPCDGEAVCRNDACREPSAKQLAQANELASMLTYVKDQTAWHAPLDWDRLRLDGRKQIFGGDESDLAYFTALYGAFVKIPQGHQGLYLSGPKACGTLVPYPGYSQRGACGRPHARGIVVTNVKPQNALGLKKGDVITKVGTVSGGAILPALATRPVCASSRPTDSFRDTTTASSFIDLLVKDEAVVIESADGTSRTVNVPDAPLKGDLESALSCQDAFGRNMFVPVESEIRPDGVGVIRLPGFTDPEQTWPANPTLDSINAYKATFEAKIKTAFDKVKSAPAIVWDIRGNGGGLTLVGLDIASGFPGARADAISYCQEREAKSDPPKFGAFKGANYALTPGGQFAYTGKVAVITDGLNYSAADYFPLAVKGRTNAIIVGAGTAGAFGAVSDSKQFAGPPSFSVSVDVNRCSSADDDTPLEGKSVTPHIAAEYDPKDLAAGKDTLLERAVAEVLK